MGRGRFLISACLTIKNDEKISIFFCTTKRNFHSEVSKTLADFMPFKRWTGVLQVQPCFEIIDYFIFGMLYLSLEHSINEFPLFKPCIIREQCTL